MKETKVGAILSMLLFPMKSEELSFTSSALQEFHYRTCQRGLKSVVSKQSLSGLFQKIHLVPVKFNPKWIKFNRIMAVLFQNEIHAKLLAGNAMHTPVFRRL